MEAFLKTALKFWRHVAGPDTRLERVLRRYYWAIRSKVDREFVGENHLVFWSREKSEHRIGIFLKGACHLRAVFACKSLIRPLLNGTCCILNDGEVSGARSDFILQAFDAVPRKLFEELCTKLSIPESYFLPSLLEPTFLALDPHGNLQEFPKSLVFLSIGSDVTRNLYRHKSTGILVDPGGWWLAQPMNRVLNDLTAVGWFRDNFENLGRLDVHAFTKNYEKIIELIRQRAGAQVVVFNVPTVELGNQVHNYQFVRNPISKRARDFNIALVELSRKLSFPIVDIDRILRRPGGSKQKDLGHFSMELVPVIADEVVAIMQDLRIF